MNKWSLLLLILLPLGSWGASELAQTVTLDGQLFQDSSGTDPLLDSHARLRIQILNGDKSCVLYEEQQYVDTTTNKGLFSIQLGSNVGDGKRVAGNDPGNPMVAVYQNTTAIPATGCAGNSSPAVAYAKRYIRMHLLRTGGVEEALNPEIELGSMPMASVAQTLQGYSASQFLILGSGDLTQTNMQSLFVTGNVAKLTSIIGNYGTNGTVQIPTTGVAPGSPQAGQVWYDSVSNKLKYFDGTTTRTLGIESGSVVSNVTAAAPLSSTGGTTPDISISKATTSTDGYLSSTDWNTFKTGADAATGATSTNTASKIVSRDASGNFAAGTISANLTGAASLNVLKAGDTLTGSLTFPANKGNVFTAGSGAGIVTMQGPTTAIGTNYVLRLPNAQGGANQVLMNDGSGNLSWTDPLSGVPSVAPIANGGTNSSTALTNHKIMVSKSGAIVESDALTNGQFLIGSAGADPVAANLTAGSGIQITNGAGTVTIATTGAQSSTLSTGKIWVGNGSSIAAEVTPSQDISVSTAGVMQVNRIQNNIISGSSVAGGLLSWDTTTSMWKGKAFPACSTSETPYYNSMSDSIACQSIAISQATASTDGYLSSADWTLFKAGADAAAGATSANTASKIVARDVSGNFAAGTITASLTGAASLNVLKSGDTLTGSLTFPANKGNVFTAGSGAGTVTIQGPTTAIGTNYLLKLPDAQGGANQVLMNDGSGNLSWIDPLSGVPGVMAIAKGGTNSSTALTNHKIMVSKSGAIVEGDALTNGQILVGATGADPVAANLTAGSGIQITNGAGSVTIATTGTQSSTLAPGKIWVGNGSSVATEVTPSQDISVSNAGVMQVNRIQNSLISGTGLTAGILSWDTATSTWKAKAFPACSTSEAPYYNSGTDSIACQSIAIPTSTLTGILAATSGGTGQSSYAIGDLLYASSTTALSRLPAGANGYVLTSAGPGTAPSWAAVPSSVGGSGTVGTYAKFTASGTVGNALVSETGSTVNVAGAIQASGPIVSAPTSGALTTFDFSTGGNVQYTSSACQAMTLAGMADGGGYTVAVQNTSGTCSFTHAGLTVKLVGGAPNLTISSHTVFTFIRAGAFVYGTWVTF